MQSFLTDTIIRAFDDVERTQYEILAQLQSKRQAFDEKILYPHMGELINTRQDLLTIHRKREHILEGIKKKVDITKIDLLNEVLKRQEITDELRDSIQDVLKLVNWAFPLVEETLDAGKEVLTETAAGIEIDWVNLISVYPDEGYLIIAEVDAEAERRLHVFTFKRHKYIADSNDPVHVLRTEPKSVESQAAEPEQLKQDLLSARTDKERAANPNPATIFVDTSVPYPFSETVFPVAKRMLLKWFLNEEKQGAN